MLSLADVFDLFADELAGLGARSFSFRLVPSGSFQCLFLGHNASSRKEHVQKSFAK
jgi:hypothetical protein